MPAACFTLSPTCVLDWDGINAVATFSATAVALAATGVAMWMPRWTRLRERSDTTNEIIIAAGEAVDLFRDAIRHIGRGSSTRIIKELGAKASHLHVALDRMSYRPELTDDAIAVAAGAIQILTAIKEESSNYRYHKDSKYTSQVVSTEYHERNISDLDQIYVRDIDYFIEIVPLILEKSQRVAAYAVKRKWPKWRMRFASIEKHGLRPKDFLFDNQQDPV